MNLHEVNVGLDTWNKISPEIQAIFNEVVRATSADASAHFLYSDMTYAQQFVDEKSGELTPLDDEALENLRRYALEVVDEYSAKDPDYCGKLGPLLHEVQTLRGLV